MPKIPNKPPEKLRPFLFHGINLSWNDRDKDAIGDCPFCGREGKFNVKIESGQWHCFVCDEKGNAYTFLRRLWKVSDEATTEYKVLAENRGLQNPDTLIHWSVAFSITTDDWLVPGYGIDGKLNQLYRYKDTEKGMRLIPTPTLGHQLHGMNLFHKKKSIIYLCEGPWDGMVLWESLSQAGAISNEEELVETANRKRSLLADANVLAVPGSNVFFEAWLPLFKGKVVNLMFDNDHPRTHPKTGKKIAPAGLNATKRVAAILRSSPNPPLEINYIHWGKTDEYNRCLPSGFDVRDSYSRVGKNQRRSISLKKRFTALVRDRYQCVVCGKNADQNDVILHVDHVLPVSKGGTNEVSNLQVLCSSCNLGKSDRIVPRPPKGSQ